MKTPSAYVRAVLAGMLALHALMGCAGMKPPAASSAGDTNCRAGPVDLSYEDRSLELVRVFTGPDGVSHAESRPQPAQESTYLGALLRQYGLGAPSNVVIVSGPPRFHIPRHPSPYREMFILLSGSSSIELSDGSQRVLRAGSVVLFEDTTGPGHAGLFGPCGYVAVDLQFKRTEPTDDSNDAPR